MFNKIIRTLATTHNYCICYPPIFKKTCNKNNGPQLLPLLLVSLIFPRLDKLGLQETFYDYCRWFSTALMWLDEQHWQTKVQLPVWPFCTFWLLLTFSHLLSQAKVITSSHFSTKLINSLILQYGTNILLAAKQNTWYFIKRTLFCFFHNSLKWWSIYKKSCTSCSWGSANSNISTKHGCWLNILC